MDEFTTNSNALFSTKRVMKRVYLEFTLESGIPTRTGMEAMSVLPQCCESSISLRRVTDSGLTGFDNATAESEQDL